MASHSSFKRLAVIVLLVAVCTPAALAAQSDAGPPFDASMTVGELFAMARDAIGLRDYPFAEKCYEEILIRDRANLQAMLELSTVYERTGKLEYARGLLIRATRIDPNYAAIEKRRKAVDDLLTLSLTEQTDSMIARGECEQAMAKLSLHLSIEPNDPSVHYKRAHCLLEMGRYDAALTDVEAAITISPQEPYFVLRDQIMGERKRADIRQLASRAATLATSDNPRNRDQALDLLAEILELDPDHAWARNEYTRLSGPVPEVEKAEDTGPGAFDNARAAVAQALTTVGRFVRAHLRVVLTLIVILAVFQSRLTRLLVRRIGPAAVLSGDLKRFSVAEVLSMINAEPRTGVLEIRGNRRGSIYMLDGEPCHCTAGDLVGIDALILLIEKARTGRFRFRDEAPPKQRTIDTPLSLLLVEQAHKSNGVVPRPGVPSVKKSRMKELLDAKL